MVLELGEQLLASSPLPGTIGTRDDVLLSMAFAYCDLAGAALEASDKVQSAGRPAWRISCAVMVVPML
jgi:hypothetical protein